MNTWQFFTSINTYAGAAIAGILVFIWAIFHHGPNEYKRAELVVTQKLTEAYDEAVGDLTDEADKAVARRVQCVASGGVWLAGRGICNQ